MANATVIPMITTSDPKLISAVNRRHRGVRARLVVDADVGEVELVAGAVSFTVSPSMMWTTGSVTDLVGPSRTWFYPMMLPNPAIPPMEGS